MIQRKRKYLYEYHTRTFDVNLKIRCKFQYISSAELNTAIGRSPLMRTHGLVGLELPIHARAVGKLQSARHTYQKKDKNKT